MNELLARIVVGYFLLVTSVASATAQEQGTSIDYAKVNDLLMIVTEKARSRYVNAETSLELKNPNLKFSDIRLWLKRNEALIREIPVNDEGKITLPVIPLDKMDGVRLFNNQAKNDTALSIGFVIRPPLSKNVSYRDLFLILKDVNEFTKEYTGIASWVIRDKVALKFQFEGAAYIEIRGAKKTYRFDTDDDLRIVVKRKRGLLKENPEITFSVLPLSVSV